MADLKTKRKAFFSGMARAFDLFGVNRSESYQEALKANFETNDKQALIHDWNTVKSDFNISIASYGIKNQKFLKK